MKTERPIQENRFLRRVHEPSQKYLEDWLDVPAHVHHVAHRMSNPPLERPQSRREFQQILKCLDIPEATSVIGEKVGYGVRTTSNGDRLILAWEAHTEYYSYQVWHIPKDKQTLLDFGPLTFPDYRFPLCPLGIRINALDLLIVPELNQPLETLRATMPGPHVYGSRVFGEEIAILTSFTPDDYQRERYLIAGPSAQVLLAQLSRVIDSVIAIENYTHLILLPFQAFSRSVDQVHKFEQRHLYQRGVITTQIDTATPHTLQQWLTILTQDFMKVSRLAESMRYKLSASVPYDTIVRTHLHGLAEQPLSCCQRLSDYINWKVTGVADGYQQFMKRIKALEHNFEGTIAVIRTKVELLLQDQNLALQDQNLKLLQSVDTTTKSQAILQHTVEGLSVIVISYYLSGLASYIFEALHEMGWIDSHAFASGLFVPISIGISFGLIVLGRKIIHTHLYPDSKP
ncbi:MAG: DUF3422 family protein [Nitrospirales bacterium]|nr:DUF3422 family protein [Nitrospirales bacterium]